MALEQEINIAEEKIEEHEKVLKLIRGKRKDEIRERYVNYLKSHKRHIMEMIKLMQKKELPQSNVEMRPLLHPERLQA